jgi:NTE family protein
MTRTGQKTAFAFAGGGSLGAIQVGMLRVLLSAGVQPDFVVGASVGAINAAYFAGAPNADGVERLAEIWSGLRRREVFPVTLKSARSPPASG